MTQSGYTRRGLLASMIPCVLRADEPKVVVPEYNRMSDEDEIALGKEFSAELEKEKKWTFVDQKTPRRYVEDLIEKIARNSRRPNLPYSIKILDTKEVNACALPGGVMYCNRGLIEYVRSESELVAVLSHEVNHVVGRHGANMFARYAAADSLLGEASRLLFGNDGPAKLVKTLGGPLAMLAMMKYSREAEREADLLGYYNMQRAGWHPQGMVDLFKHFGEKSPAYAPLLSVLSTHPDPSDRESVITAEMRRYPPRADLVRDDPKLKEVQAELKRLPAPKVVQKAFSD